MVKRILRSFRLTEISAVDRPAQAHAKMTIMKRDEGKEELDMSNVNIGALALLLLEGKATALMKAHPELSEAQAFSKVYADPANRVIAEAERRAARSGIPVARTEPKILSSLDDGEIKSMIDEERRRNPFLSAEQIFSRLYNSAAGREDRARFQAALRDFARKATEVYFVADHDTNVAKRDNAMDALTAKAEEYRRAHPDVSPEQAFAKVYRANGALAAAERSAARAAIGA